MPLLNGETFAGFRIVRLLGSGGMAEVYLAQHPRLHKHNALKTLRRLRALAVTGPSSARFCPHPEVPAIP